MRWLWKRWWAWGLAISVLTVGLGLFLFPPRELPEEKFARIKDGMTKEQFVMVFGKQADQDWPEMISHFTVEEASENC
jgi:hypothetical protein